MNRNWKAWLAAGALMVFTALGGMRPADTDHTTLAGWFAAHSAQAEESSHGDIGDGTAPKKPG